MIETDLFTGHRQRVKQRFIESAIGKVADYEILEMILFLAKPRSDVKPLAKTLLANFGSLKKVLSADKMQLLQIKGVGEGVVSTFRLFIDVSARMLKEEFETKNIISSWSQLLDYLKLTMGNAPTEHFRILFLNRKNVLIADDLQETGTIDQTPVYPREVVKKALFYEASAIILVHNHPSGNCNPSKSDITMTHKVVEACAAIGVVVHDHVIITNNDYFSFKSHMLIK